MSDLDLELAEQAVAAQEAGGEMPLSVLEHFARHGITPAGPAQEAQPLVPRAKPNRAARRKMEAFQKSAKWQNILRNSEKAAVRKLNRLSEARRAQLAQVGDPED